MATPGVEAAPATSSTPAQQILTALRYAPASTRNARTKALLASFKEQGLVAGKPQRSDYTDYHAVKKPLTLFNHDVLIIEREYMAQYVGCCVSEGAGLVLRAHGNLKELKAFAKKNKCRVEEYPNEKVFIKEYYIQFPLPAGPYARLSCRERDEND